MALDMNIATVRALRALKANDSSTLAILEAQRLSPGDVHRILPSGHTFLSLSAQLGNFDALRFFIAIGADPRTDAPVNSPFALDHAIERQDVTMARLLISWRARTRYDSSEDLPHDSPERMAIQSYARVADLRSICAGLGVPNGRAIALFCAPDLVDEPNHEGDTALIFSARRGNIKSCDALIDYGASLCPGHLPEACWPASSARNARRIDVADHLDARLLAKREALELGQLPAINDSSSQPGPRRSSL